MASSSIIKDENIAPAISIFKLENCMSDEKKIEPTMSEPATPESTQPVSKDTSHEQNEASSAQEPTTSGLHRITPNNSQAEQNKPNTANKLMGFLPLKHRRLFIAFFALLLLIILYIWLSPSSEPANSPTAQAEKALPVEFQLINEQQQQQLQTQANDSQIASDESVGAGDAVIAPQASSTVLDAQGDTININPPTVQETTSQPVTALTPIPSDSTSNEANKSIVIKEPKITEVTRPVSEVIAQPAVKPIAKPDTKPVVKPTVKAIVEQPKVTSREKTKDVSLTMQKGVSLMQLFRNNKLNISDVNAMSKAPGANQIFSRLRPGENIILQLNQQGRVSRMIMHDGKVFTRQSNGSYTLK